MQEPPKQKQTGRFALFLKKPRGQVLSTCSAVSALLCVIIGLLLSDYTRLAWPFVLTSFFLALLGVASNSRRSLAQVVLALWVIQGQSLLQTTFDLGTQASLQAQLQQQTIQIENQFRKLQEQEDTLETQLSLLQNLYKGASSYSNGTNQYYNALQATQIELADLQGWIDNPRVTANYNTFLLEENARLLPSTSLLKQTKDAVQIDGDVIWVDQFATGNAAQTIANNNLVLPQAVVPQVPVVEQKDCVSGFVCISRLSWQEPFITGWLTLSRTPFSTTWPFWLSLLLALSGMFLLLPRSMGKRWIVSYRVRYSGALAALNDSTFPEQKRKELSGETLIIKIEIRSTRFLLKQKDWADETRELLRINLGIGTSISSVFSKETSTSEVSYDTGSGEIVVKVQPLAQVKIATRRDLKALQAFRKSYFPIILYAVVDSFANSLEASTPIAEVDRLQEQRGPGWLVNMADVFRALVWWIYATGLFTALTICSLMFFRGSPYSYPPTFISFGLGGCAAALILGIAAALITRVTTRQQKLASALLPAA